MIKLPPAIKPARTAELLPLLRAGDRAAGREVAEGHMRFANSRCRRYGQAGYDMSDIAFEAVWNAILAIMDGELAHDNVSGFIALKVRGALRDEYQKSRLLSPARNTNKYREDQGLVPYKRLRRRTVSDFEDHEGGAQAEAMLAEILDLAETDIEKQIIQLRAAGHSDVEIASLIKRSESWVFQTRKALSRKYSQTLREGLQ